MLSSDAHVMQWNPVLNIYRVNRYQGLELQEKIEKFRYDETRVDFLEELLDRNMDHVASTILSYFKFQDLCHLQLVSTLWNQFIGTYVFKRKIERLVIRDEGLKELSELEGWNSSLFRPVQEVSDPSIYKKMCAKVFLLKDIWRFREPKAKRLFCDSFVLSVRSDDSIIFCGLNNGCIQAWDISYLGKIREQECHDKGVKCIDFNASVFLTGSYDTFFKVWRRDTWSCIQTFPVHTDSVWDLKLHGNIVATAGLDGAVIIYDFVSEYDLRVRSYIQAHGDLVSAVDFSSVHLVTGFEDAMLGVWELPGGTKIHSLPGHTGGVTGVQIHGTLAATSSYDCSVRLWDVSVGVCLLKLSDQDNFARCIGFSGNRIVSGDFGGNILMWDLAISPSTSNRSVEVKVLNTRKWEAHKGHVVCIQLNARRIISGSRDRTLMINDFWLKTMDTLSSIKKENSTAHKYSRFLKRHI
ncbi:F-box/WD repeat-containing protein 11 [Eurytemora carolleeae]|uniref:F-box/WD repeat-containing protein 11 n=1 Tax=Eurytemora carolleeae TaxID=1294199 RepID=UPI000C7934CF|nr:F-box/WD repeat-containing protein 11 [Eurytemora carolleeae]XP_023319809.1 F-box/WD repeat-containing protein 11 [Eurytemora carolleeae]|eukprot:XP_023319808.1 F-box/WD repeat-containing protein 11-like [Eurytemora affinis]